MSAEVDQLRAEVAALTTIVEAATSLGEQEADLTAAAITRKPSGYRADRRRSTHPVAEDTEKVVDVDTAFANFDMITYAKGNATLKNASIGEARSVAATSIGRGPIASKARCIGCTAKGIEKITEPISRPVKVNDKTPHPIACVNWPNGPCGPITTSR